MKDEIRGRTGEEDDLFAAMYYMTCSVTASEFLCSRRNELEGLESGGGCSRGTSCDGPTGCSRWGDSYCSPSPSPSPSPAFVSASPGKADRRRGAWLGRGNRGIVREGPADGLLPMARMRCSGRNWRVVLVGEDGGGAGRRRQHRRRTGDNARRRRRRAGDGGGAGGEAGYSGGAGGEAACGGGSEGGVRGRRMDP
jgi:hypothetical protein